MPVKNVEQYIQEAIESVLKQSYINFELIVIDDSNDKTADIVHGFNDKRIKYYNFEGNISKALNFGIEKAKGKYIARMDSDDYCHPDRLIRQISIMEKDGYDVVGCNMRILKQNGAFYEDKIFPENDEEIKFYMPINTSLPHPTIVARKEIFEEIRYNEDLIYAEDMDMFLRLIEKGYIFYNLQDNLYYYRLTKDYYDVYSKENTESYKLGKRYLEKLLKNTDTADFSRNLLRLALLEYYKGNLRKARLYLLEHIKLNPENKNELRRYLMISRLHPYVLRIFRKFRIPQQFNRRILKYFKKDLQYSSKNTAV